MESNLINNTIFCPNFQNTDLYSFPQIGSLLKMPTFLNEKH